LQMAAQQLKERQNLGMIHRLFEAQDIPYFIFKGANLRYTLYQNQTLRSACDIDVMVPEPRKLEAVNCFIGEGFELQVKPENTSHEVSLNKSGVCIDLHWHLLRPGRARQGVVAWLFEHREKFEGFEGLDATASLLVTLVHPAITKYLLSPTSILMHQVDQARLIQGGKVDWEELAQALSRYGMRTAAWSSLYVLEKLGGITAPDGFAERIQPGGLHRWYLKNWIDRDWISKWFERPWLVAGFFSLALQDNLKDAYRALRSLRQARSEEKKLLTEFER
jgi:hypothetical protein